MAFLIMILRKLTKNKWLNICLLTGLIICAALVSSIPLYTEGVLQKLLTGELEQFQKDRGIYPGRVMVKVDMGIKTSMNEKRVVHSFIQRRVTPNEGKLFGVPVNTLVQNNVVDNFHVLYDNNEKVINLDQRTSSGSASIESYTGFFDRINLIDGKLPGSEPVKDAYEVIVSESCLNNLRLTVGKTYLLNNFIDEKLEPMRVTVVGVFEPKDASDPYWQINYFAMEETLVMDNDLFARLFMNEESYHLTNINYFLGLDYHAITIHDLEKIVDVFKNFNKEISEYGYYKAEFPALSIMNQYFEREKQISITLWSINAPVIIMLCFYIFMVSKLIIEKQKTEIAVLRSRGAGRGQILFSYFAENLVLDIIALFIGPPLGLFLCRILGYSSGFLEFVQRGALPVKMNPSVYLYALAALALSTVMMLIPAWFASSSTIVSHKQELARTIKKPVWQKYFFDVLLIVVAVYGYYTFNRRQQDLLVTGASATDLQVDPLLFFIPSIFVFGVGLLVLRLYPFFLKFVYWLGKRYWKPSIYFSLIQVGRSSFQYHFIMIFLTITVAMGFYSANAARTLNSNAEEKIQYSIGADISLRVVWDTIVQQPTSDTGEDGENSYISILASKVYYVEPPLSAFTSLDGVQDVARVFRNDKASVRSSTNSTAVVTLMGVIPSEFSKVAWFRQDLTSVHWFNYLKLIAPESGGCIISSSLAKLLELKVGDTIYVTWDSGGAQLMVMGIMDYFPSWNPNKTVQNSKEQEPALVVANLSYLQANSQITPYDIWIKKKPGATTGQIIKSIEKNGLKLQTFKDANQEIIKMKNTPFQLGVNGAMTMSFIIIMSIGFMGFLLYWILTISSRVMQYGILRAIGLSFIQLIEMLGWEQILSSGVAITAGVFLGKWTARLFVPFFQMSYSSEEQVPPFRVVQYASDQAKLFIIIATMMILGIAILTFMLSRIKISQAVKLGEDQ